MENSAAGVIRRSFRSHSKGREPSVCVRLWGKYVASADICLHTHTHTPSINAQQKDDQKNLLIHRKLREDSINILGWGVGVGVGCQCFSSLMRVSYTYTQVNTHIHTRLCSQYIKSRAANKMLMVVNEADEVASDGEREPRGQLLLVTG